jgi:hypothetical protein
MPDLAALFRGVCGRRLRSRPWLIDERAPVRPHVGSDQTASCAAHPRAQSRTDVSSGSQSALIAVHEQTAAAVTADVAEGDGWKCFSLASWLQPLRCCSSNHSTTRVGAAGTLHD